MYSPVSSATTPLLFLYIYTLDQKKKQNTKTCFLFQFPLGAWRAIKTFRYNKITCSLPFPIKDIKACEFRGDLSARLVISTIKINWNCRRQGQIGKVKEEGDEERKANYPLVSLLGPCFVIEIRQQPLQKAEISIG